MLSRALQFYLLTLSTQAINVHKASAVYRGPIMLITLQRCRRLKRSACRHRCQTLTSYELQNIKTSHFLKHKVLKSSPHVHQSSLTSTNHNPPITDRLHQHKHQQYTTASTFSEPIPHPQWTVPTSPVPSRPALVARSLPFMSSRAVSTHPCLQATL